jgi:hypothetical protein
MTRRNFLLGIFSLSITPTLNKFIYLKGDNKIVIRDGWILLDSD